MNAAPEHSEFENVLVLIQEAKARVYAKANEELVLLYFHVGQLVSAKVNQGSWGDGTVNELADFIAEKNPELSGFNRRGLYRMKQFYETYADKEFVTTLLSQIQWSSHLHILNKTKTHEEKVFYLHLGINEKLSVRELERQINAATYERTLLSNKTNESLTKHMPKGLFKDPYIFEFLNLPEQHSEKDFESAIVLNLQKFILEVGKGFSYMGSQYRLQVGNKDFYTDLLFYHRDLQCLVLFELKIEDFEPEFLGKLNFYLEALDRDVKRPHENPSIGILLCKGKDTEVVEYAMARNISPALVADYEIKLIDKKLLANKLHQLAQTLTKDTEQ